MMLTLRASLVYRWKVNFWYFCHAAFSLGYRPTGWLPPTCCVGEAKTPGPIICCVNPGGWSRVDPTLLLAHDIIAVQETFVLREHLSSAKHQAAQMGKPKADPVALQTSPTPPANGDWYSLGVGQMGAPSSAL
eukprot:5987003-Amphidinium_carterae.1